MIVRILAFSVHQRWLVTLLTVAAAAFGGWSMAKLPIDAVPDITNRQVQINTVAPALSPNDAACCNDDITDLLHTFQAPDGADGIGFT